MVLFITIGGYRRRDGDGLRHTGTGFGCKTVNNMRLWSAKSSRDFDLRYSIRVITFRLSADKNDSENLSKVLYPDDSTEMGRELRLKQQYFFVSASLQDMLHRYKKKHEGWAQLPDKVAVQMNDTHPSIAIAEMMYQLVDVHKLKLGRGMGTDHTHFFLHQPHVDCRKRWKPGPVSMFESMLPRHLQIIFEINHRFLQKVMHQFPGRR